MLVLVRLLSPEQYGAMALSQAILGIVTLIAAGTFVGHALQVRDPSTIDWQSHFTAATVWSAAIGLIVLSAAEFLAAPVWGADVGQALALLSLVLFIGAPAEVRNAMLNANHNWARVRLLSLLGTFLALGVGIGLALAGFGVAALAVQPALFVLPAAIDLFWSGFRPTWQFDRKYYRDVISFGLNRFTGGALGAARGFIEQALMAATFSLAVNGVYGRSLGLANLLVGRLGMISVGALYPILTRAERGSSQFRRKAALVLQGIAWIAIPAATYLAIEADPIVALLYGDGWTSVAQLLPAAAAVGAAGALHFTVSRVLLANESRNASLAIDVSSGIVSIALAFWLLPQGPLVYLWALAIVGLIGFLFGAFFLIRDQAVGLAGLALATIPPTLATSLAAISIFLIKSKFQGLWPIFDLIVTAVCFSSVFSCFLLAFFRRSLFDLLAILPGGPRLIRVISLGQPLI